VSFGRETAWLTRSRTILLKHWAGRNSRGVSQFEGRTINELIVKPEFVINLREARQFLERVIAL
jgi:hypothetical protein